MSSISSSANIADTRRITEEKSRRVFGKTISQRICVTDPESNYAAPILKGNLLSEEKCPRTSKPVALRIEQHLPILGPWSGPISIESIHHDVGSQPLPQIARKSVMKN